MRSGELRTHPNKGPRDSGIRSVCHGPRGRARTYAQANAKTERRRSGLALDAVVHRGTVVPPGLGVLAVTRAVSFRLFERTSLAPFVHGGLTRTQSRTIVRGRRIRASGDKCRAT